MAPVLSAFSHDGSYFAQIAADNRVKIWDVISGNLQLEYVDPNHLTLNLTCLSWSHAAPTKKRKKARTEGAQYSDHFLAFGTSNGQVIIYDLKTGDVKHRYGGNGKEGHVKPVRSILFLSGSKTDRVISACDEGIVEFSMSSESLQKHDKKKSLSSMSANSSGSVLYAGYRKGIRAIALESFKRRCQYQGHGRPPVAMRVCRGDSLVLSNPGDQFVSVWSGWDEDEDRLCSSIANDGALDGDEETSGVAPLASLALNACSVGISVSSHTTGAVEDVAVVTAAGNVELFRISDAQKVLSGALEENVFRSDGTIYPGGVGAKSTSIMDCVFLSGHRIVVAVAAGVRPRFHVLEYETKGRVVSELRLPDEVAQGDLLQSTKGVTRVSKASSAVAQATTGKTTQIKDASLRATGTAEETTDALATQLFGTSGTDIGEGSGETLEERIRELGITPAPEVEKTEAEAVVAPKKKPSGQSLTQLVSQALESDDQELLESVLGVVDRKVLFTTVERLPAQWVIPFLDAITKRFQRRPQRGAVLGPWIRAILICHASYLMSAQSASDSLAALHDIIHHRLKVYPRLLRLHGRLDLVATQVQRRRRHATGAGKGKGMATGKQGAPVFKEDDMSDPEPASEAGSDEVSEGESEGAADSGDESSGESGSESGSEAEGEGGSDSADDGSDGDDDDDNDDGSEDAMDDA